MKTELQRILEAVSVGLFLAACYAIAENDPAATAVSLAWLVLKIIRWRVYK